MTALLHDERPRRVLVIDDNPKIHEDFVKILGWSGSASVELDEAELALFGRNKRPPPRIEFRIESAHRGEDGPELIRRAIEAGDPHGVAFVDIRMPPGWDGVRTASQLWAVDPRLQIVFCTAYSDHSWEDMVEQLGLVDNFLVLKKPFDSIEVRQLAVALWQKWSLLREKESREELLESQVLERSRQLELELSERLRVERELRQSQKTEALGRMAAGLSHEINNPLSFVISNLEFCLAELKGLETPASRPDLPSMADALIDAADGAERIRRIVQNVRTFATRVEESIGAVDLRAILADAAKQLTHAVRPRHRLSEDIGELPAVMAESHRLQQVFLNLLVNASQAMPERPAEENRIEIIARAVGPEVLVEVRDTGQGIPAADLERVFDPFFTRRDVGQGMGLGLSICRGIVESFGGRIAVESEEGRGTVVRVWLRAAVPGVRAVTPLNPVAGARVLVVDDEPSALRGLERLLKGHRMIVTTSGSGQEALALYDQGCFDLVLCDLLMPGCGGIEVFESIAMRGPQHARRVIFMTAGSDLPRSTRSGAPIPNRFLEKPCTLAALLEAMEEVLGAR